MSGVHPRALYANQKSDVAVPPTAVCLSFLPFVYQCFGSSVFPFVYWYWHSFSPGSLRQCSPGCWSSGLVRLAGSSGVVRLLKRHMLKKIVYNIYNIYTNRG